MTLVPTTIKPTTLKVLRAIQESPFRMIDQSILGDVIERKRWTINREIKRLEQMGLIEIRQTSKRHPCIYKILPQARLYLRDDND